MSDLCMYELEDIVWDDFSQSDDHIVPHPSDEQANESLVRGNNRKKPRKEVTCVASDAGGPISQQKTEQKMLSLHDRRNKMMEKEAWSTKQENMLPSPCDQEISSLASDGTKTSNGGLKSNIESVGSELSDNDSILNDKSAAVNNSFGYPLAHISEADHDLSFFGNSNEVKDANDLLYCSWSEIGNFEDVDRLFRSCDSTFGLGSSGDDDLGWFSPSGAIGDSDDALKSDFKFPCPEPNGPKSIPEMHDPYSLNGTSDESTVHNGSIMYRDNFAPTSKDASSSFGNTSFPNGSDGPNSKYGFMAEEQVNAPKKQLKRHNQSEMERTDHYFENGSFFSIGNTSEIVQQQRQALDSDSFGYLRCDIPYVTGHDQPSDQTSTPNSSAVKLKNSSLSSPSPKGSYPANQVDSLEGSSNPSFQVISMSSNENGEKLHHQQGSLASLDAKNVDFAAQTPKGVPVLVEKKSQYSGSENENHADDNQVKLGMPVEFGSSVIRGSSSTKSTLDDISVEATSFRQLQLVMERLDIRTKLCIRDSLYRLARSAEQRHTCANLSGGRPDDPDAGGALMGEGRHKYTGFMDIETDTNPIDRSVAHLLFHRPSDPSVTAGNNSTSFNSPAPIHGPIKSSPSPLTAGGFVKREESAGETERKVVGN